MHIHLLNEQLANQIAAGEVIERPSSVVKELVENAIDAGAGEIRVVIEEAGRKLISVTDNGSGMTAEDAVLSLQRHATSKITTTDDLFSIRTLGFRGEALPSIAAVSYLKLITRPADAEVGTELRVTGGTITDMAETGCPVGTQIEVRQLFYNTPARLKFLKTDQTEFGQITELMNALALCYHELDLRLWHNGREVLARPSSTQMLSPIAAWLGREAAGAMAAVELATPGITVSGFVGKPEVARGNRGAQLFFINGRRISSRSLTHALEFAFQGLLGPGRFPVGVLKITVDPQQVDVNVHPAKAEVRFHHEGDIHAAVVRAVKTALAGVSMVQQLSVWNPGEGRPAARPAMGNPANTLLEMDYAVHTHASMPPLTVPPAPASVTGLRAVGQLYGTFLLAEGRDALIIINQHRAHERVIFERLLARAAKPDAQMLMLPATVHLGLREAALLEAQLENLAAFGFDIGALSGGSYIIRAVPSILAGRDPEKVLQGVLDDLGTGVDIAPFATEGDPSSRAMQEARRRLLASVACKAALKAGKILTQLEQDELLTQLQATEQPTLCPHGGPIIMTISQYELDKRFAR